MMANLEAAYAPLRASLLSGGFADPESGAWSAELVAAHLVINNDAIAGAAEALVRGEEVAYDNALSVDEANLSRYAAAVGGLAGLADELQRSASRLDHAYRALGHRAATSIQVRIRDGQEIAYDGPMPIGAFMEGNATRHLELHHDQLKALHGPWVADPPDEFDTYQLIILTRAANRPQLDDADGDSLQRQHLGHFSKMRAAGYMTVAGPVEGDDDIAGICIYRARSVEEARLLAEDDPSVRAGRLEVRTMTWLTARGALSDH